MPVDALVERCVFGMRPPARLSDTAPCRWAEAERLRLKRAIDMYGDMYGWTKISSFVGTKSSVACKSFFEKNRYQDTAE